MSTFEQDPSNDLQLRRNKRGKLNLVLVKDPVVAGAIKLRNRFQFFLREWFLDQREGVPYFQVVFVKNPDVSAIRQLFLRIILGVKVIASCPTLELTYDRRTREMAFSFVAYASDGRKITGGSGEPFLVDGQPLTARGV